MKKLRLRINDRVSVLQLEANGTEAAFYTLTGSLEHKGTAAIAETQPGVFSILLEGRSYPTQVVNQGGILEIWVGNRRYSIGVSDLRDRGTSREQQSQAGPLELRALMPGKVVKLLVEPGARVESGQPLIVVEAMKMQNEMKSSKDGVVTKIHVSEGATVASGERLMVVE